MPLPSERLPIADGPLSVILLIAPETMALDEPVKNWSEYLDKLGREFEILLVAEGGDEHLKESLPVLLGLNNHIRFIEQVEPPGVGSAFRAALKEARFPLLFYTDGTTCYKPSDLGKMLELIDQVDIVTGFRSGRFRRSRWKMRDRLVSWILHWIFGVHLKDVDCAFKLFRRAIFGRIPIQSDGPFVHTEIMAKANFLGCLIAEIEVAYQPLPAPPANVATLRERYVEAVRIFRHPDFGPAHLSEEQPVHDPEVIQITENLEQQGEGGMAGHRGPLGT